jgi:hypothetical protein
MEEDSGIPSFIMVLAAAAVIIGVTVALTVITWAFILQ